MNEMPRGVSCYIAIRNGINDLKEILKLNSYNLSNKKRL